MRRVGDVLEWLVVESRKGCVCITLLIALRWIWRTIDVVKNSISIILIGFVPEPWGIMFS